MEAVDPGRRWEQIQLLFDEVIDLEPGARASRLEEIGRQDPSLHAAVVPLLDAFDGAGDFMGLLDGGEKPHERYDGTPPAAGRFRLGTPVGRYRIIREIGRGGMGEVYLAQDQRLGRPVALKFLSPPLSNSPEAAERLYAEARSAAALDHPNIATIFEVGQEEGRPFIAMTFYEGETLKERMARGPLPVGEALEIAAQVASGLAAAHRKGIVHRDIKPSNILLPGDGLVKITDFGIAKTAGRDLTRSGRILGTPAYMAPEQLKGEPAGPRSDLWSLGVVLYEMLSGRKAFRGESDASLIYAILHQDPARLCDLRPDVPPEVDAVVRRATAKDVETRYSSADTLLQDLRRLQTRASFHVDEARRAAGPAPAHVSPESARHPWPANLPVHLTELIGRDRELQQLKNLILKKGCRLLTLTGPGGTGKTRLAVRLASDLTASFAGRVCFVSLAAIEEAALVGSTTAHALGLREVVSESVRDRLVAFLEHERGVLVLDSFEHVTAAAELVADLLASCPGLIVLVTSRARLQLQGEREFPVPPLAVPEAWAVLPKQMRRCPSVALFAARAREVQPGFTIHDGNAPAVAEICARLDGLPLAIELAAAQIKVLAPAALLARLQHRFDVLECECPDRPARHRTLREAIAWSYELLDPAEQALFRRLGVFAGGCSFEAAEAISDPDAHTPPNTLRMLASLIDKSLLKQEEEPGDEPRFVMLETIREYALDRLRACDEEAEARRRHLDFFLAFAEGAVQQLTGPDQAAWFDRLEREHNNLRAALTLALSERSDTAARLAAALCRFWLARGFVREGFERATDTLDVMGRSLAPLLRAHLLMGTAMLAADAVLFSSAAGMLREALELLRQENNASLTGEALNHLSWNLLCMGEHGTAQAHAQEALAIFSAVGHERGIGVALNNLGFSTFLQGDYGVSAAYFDESVAYCRRTGDLRSLTRGLANLAYAYYYQGHLEKAEALQEEAVATAEGTGDVLAQAVCHNRLVLMRFEQGKEDAAAELLNTTLPLFRASGYAWGLLACLNIAGYVLLQSGALEQAYAVDDELLQYARQVGCRPAVALVLCRRGELRYREGDTAGAERSFLESLRLRREMEEKAGTAECLEGLARIALDRHKGRRAAVLLGAAETIREASQAAVLPRRAPDHRAFIRDLRTALGEEAFSSALAEGRQMNLHDAVDYGLQEHRTG